MHVSSLYTDEAVCSSLSQVLEPRKVTLLFSKLINSDGTVDKVEGEGKKKKRLVVS